MTTQAQLLFLYVFLACSAYAADSEKKEALLEQKGESKLQLLQNYEYTVHKNRNELCYLMRFSPHGLMLSAGYNPHDKHHYVRLHKTDNGQEFKINDSSSVLHKIENTITDATWSPDGSYVSYTDAEVVYISPVLQAPQSIPAHVAKSYINDEHNLYQLISLSKADEGGLFLVSHDKKTKTMFGSSQSFAKSSDHEGCLPSQSCFLNAGALSAVYLPALHIFAVFDCDKIPKTPITWQQNVTSADLSQETPIIGTLDGTVSLVNCESGKLFTTVRAFKQKAVTAVALAPQYIAALSDLDIRIVALVSGKQVSHYTHEAPYKPQLLRFMHQGAVVAYTAGRILTTFDAQTATQLHQVLLDSEPHSMISEQAGLFIGTPASIGKFTIQEVAPSQQQIKKRKRDKA